MKGQLIKTQLFLILLLFGFGLLAQNDSKGKELWLAPVKANNKWGFIDPNGDYAFPSKYDFAGEFSENLAAVKTNEKWGFINSEGVFVVNPVYQDAHSFSGGYARVKIGNKWGYVNNAGILEIAPTFDAANDFSEGWALVKKEGKYGYINKKGAYAIEATFDDAFNFSEGNAAVSISKKWYILDKNGNLSPLPEGSIPYPYFSEGLSAININGKYGFINNEGLPVISVKYDDVKDFSENIAAVSYNNQYGFINYSDKFVIQPSYDNASHFSEGLAAVKINDSWGYVNIKGGFVIDPDFEEAHPFYKGLAKIKKDGRYGLIDNKGNIVVSPDFAWIFDFAENGLAAVEWNRLFGFINTKGEYVKVLKYDGAGSFRKVSNFTAAQKPQINITQPVEAGLTVSDPVYTINASIISTAPLLDRSLIVNNVMYDLDDVAQRGTLILPVNKAPDDHSIAIRTPITLLPGENKIYFKAVNTYGSATSSLIEINYQPPPKTEKPDLYVLTIGISEFEQDDYNIKYADNDAEDISNYFKQQMELPFDDRLYNQIIVQKLTNEEATSQNIKRSILQIKNMATENDLFILHISSHGEIDGEGNYYIRTYETDPGMEYLSATALENKWIAEQIREFSCTTIQFIDACHSGSGSSDIAMRGPLSIDVAVEELKTALKSKALYFFASSSQKQLSQERGEWANGAFTEAILACFQGQEYVANNNKSIIADSDNDGFINTDELSAYVSQVVKTLTNGQQTPKATIQNGETINLFVLPKK